MGHVQLLKIQTLLARKQVKCPAGPYIDRVGDGGCQKFIVKWSIKGKNGGEDQKLHKNLSMMIPITKMGGNVNCMPNKTNPFAMFADFCNEKPPGKACGKGTENCKAVSKIFSTNSVYIHFDKFLLNLPPTRKIVQFTQDLYFILTLKRNNAKQLRVNVDRGQHTQC